MRIESLQDFSSLVSEPRLMNNDGDFLQNKYSLVKGTARRARHLLAGAPSLGISHSLKVCRVAEEEIRAGRVTFSVTLAKPAPRVGP